MFDIYSLAKPRVFMKTDDGGGGSDIPSETPAVDSVEYESATLKEYIGAISDEDAEDSGHPESAGRVFVEMKTSIPMSVNVINTASDLGGRATRIVNNPFSAPAAPEIKLFRTEFRPKQGLHNLDFTRGNQK